MINWKKISSGEYESDCSRFSIVQGSDCVHGKHWALRDRNELDHCKSFYYEESLEACMKKAEALVG